MPVRRPSWADQFYPANPEDAKAMWEDFFERAEKPRIEEEIRAVQVPHAGWVYSGQAAAEAFKQLEARDYQTVVMIGPQHRVPVSHIQVYPEGIWESPVGNLEVDADLSERFTGFDPAFKPDVKAHQAEHSLEVQLPPLAMVQPDVRIVPILTAAYQKEHPKILARALSEIVGKDSSILVLVSTDLYHGESYQAAKKSDELTTELTENLDAEKLENALRTGAGAACGGDGLLALLYAADEMGIKKARLLAAYNSNDATGMQGGYVVGYSAFAFV